MVDEPSAHAVFIQVATKSHQFRGRRPGVATGSTFALPEGDPVGSMSPLPALLEGTSILSKERVSSAEDRAVDIRQCYADVK